MLIVWALDKRIDQEWVGCSVLFGWCKGEGVTSQVIHIIQKSNNMFIDMSQVVHIIQKLNIMSCFHSLHVDILESIYLGLWRVVSFTCVWHHISRYIFNFTYQNNLNLNNIIEAWCCRLPSIPLVPCTTLVPLSLSFHSVPEIGKTKRKSWTRIYIVGMIISYFYFKFHSKLSLWYQLSNLPTVKIFFVENKIKTFFSTYVESY